MTMTIDLPQDMSQEFLVWLGRLVLELGDTGLSVDQQPSVLIRAI